MPGQHHRALHHAQSDDPAGDVEEPRIPGWQDGTVITRFKSGVTPDDLVGD